jgi:long-chain acyl-CoA synthetase
MALKIVPDTDFRLQWIDLWNEYVHTVPQMFYSSVRHHGDRNAHIFWKNDQWQTINYRTFATIAEEIAAGLLSLGIRKGDNLVIMSQNCAEWGWADMGTELAGGCTTTIFPSLRPDEVKFIVNHSQVNYFFAGNEALVKMIQGLKPELPSLKGIICLQGDLVGYGNDLWTLDELRSLGKEFITAHPSAVKERYESITPEDAATTVYTSGTTGKLKAARLSHREITDGLWLFKKSNDR